MTQPDTVEWRPRFVGKYRGRKYVTLLDVFRAELDKAVASTQGIRWPSPKYQADPAGFFRDILGVEPWSRQLDIINAIRDHDRVAVKSGRRVSKSHTAAGIALWWYCSFPDARVIMSSTTDRQVNQILWRELSMMRARAGRCLACKEADPNGHKIPTPCPHSAVIDGDRGELARTGLKSDDFRIIQGFTARQAEAIQGIAGSRLLFILDEASGIPQGIFDAVEGNRAGGGKVLLFGNPTRNQGEFFDAFHKKNIEQSSDGVGYHCLTVSSKESPNVAAGKPLIPGLATREYIREREIEWGRESAMFKVHVEGEFALSLEGGIFSIDSITRAEERWHETEAEGRLYIGLDPAGPTGNGDETVFCIRRGLKVLDFFAHRGLDDAGHLSHLLGIVQEYRLPKEVPVVVLDREGSIGSSLYGIAGNHAGKNKSFELVGVRSSDRAHRKPTVYDRQRDALAGNLEQWFKDGGTIPEDAKLEAELHSLAWKIHINGRQKLTPKDKIRKEIGRSPDRYDALALACWEPLSLRDDPLAESVQALARVERKSHHTEIMDPYGGMDAFDPYR